MKLTNIKKTETGAALIEFALVLSFLFAMLMGIVECGLLLYNQQVLTNASREGARAGIAYKSKDDIDKIVDDYCNERLIRFSSATNPTVEIDPITPPSYGDGNNIKVIVTYNYTFLLPGIIGFKPSLNLTAATEMKMEPVVSP